MSSASSPSCLSSLLDAWLEHERAHGRSAAHLRASRYGARRCLRWLAQAHAVVTADRLRREHLEAWQRHLFARRTSKGAPLKPSSINREIETIRGLLAWLGGRGLVPPSLLAAIAYVQQPRLLPTSVLTHAQMRRALARLDATTPEGVRDRAMLELLYSSGIRAAELLGLGVRDVDLDNATALVMGKGGKQRVVPIGRTALRHLESYLRGVRPLLARDPAEAGLWLRPNGRRLAYPALRRLVLAHLGKAALPVHVTAHTFRRSCTTELIRGGANLWHVKELLGHDNLDTLQHYAKLTIADLKKTHAKCHPRERDERA